MCWTLGTELTRQPVFSDRHVNELITVSYLLLSTRPKLGSW